MCNLILNVGNSYLATLSGDVISFTRPIKVLELGLETLDGSTLSLQRICWATIG